MDLYVLRLPKRIPPTPHLLRSHQRADRTWRSIDWVGHYRVCRIIILRESVQRKSQHEGGCARAWSLH